MLEPPQDVPVALEDVLDSGAAGGLVMRGGVLRLIGFGAGALLAAVSSIVLTRKLGVPLFGQYAAIIALATLVAQVTEGGLTGMATRDIAQQPRVARAKLLGDRLGLQIVTTFLAVGLCVLFAVAAGYEPARIWGTFAAAVGIALAMLQMTLAVPLLASLRLGTTSALEVIRQAILVVLTVSLALAGGGVALCLTALIPSSLIVLVATWVLARREIPVRPTFHPHAWVALVRPAIVLSLSSGVASIYVFATQVLTSLSATPFENGLYAASLRVFAVVASIPGVVVISALPLLSHAARNDADRLRFAMQRLFEVALVAGLGVGIVLVVGAPPLIAVLAGHKYAGAVGPLRIEGAAVLGTCLTPVWSSALLALHRHASQLIANVISLAVTVTLTLTLAPRLGARGSALATVGGEWMVALCLLFALMRAERRLVPSPRGVAPRVLLASAAALASLLLPVPAIVQLAVAIPVYAGLILALRALPRELLELIPARWPGRA